MKNSQEEFKYYIIRGQRRHIDKKRNQFADHKQIKVIECCPNATVLWNLVKEKLSDNLDYCGNKLNLVDINQTDFLQKLEDIYNERKNVVL
jgi:hypothetical protein